MPKKPSAKPEMPANAAPAPAGRDLDNTVAELNKELETMAPGLDAEDVKPVSEESDEIDLDKDVADDLLSEELAKEIEEAEAEPVPKVKNTEPAEPEPMPQASDSEDKLTEEAIDDIVAKESDIVLAAEDEVREVDSLINDELEHRGVKAWLKSLWADKRKRWLIGGGGVVLLLAVGLLPHSRYFVLNSVGVRSSLQLTVIDGSTLQPLKNVTVRAGGAEAKTDGEGFAHLSSVRLGKTILQVEKRAFAPIDKAITVGWGSNPLGEFRATAVGTQYTFLVRDFLSGQPLDKAEAISGDGNASSDGTGKIVLTLDTAELSDDAPLAITISAENYRDETVEISANNKEEQSVNMVPARKSVYVSKRSGKYDVYAAYADGSDEQRLVEGSGLERDDIGLVPYPGDHLTAYVATRENTRNPSGYLLSTLYLVNSADGTITKIDQSEQIRLVGWSTAGRLIYVKVAAGASGTDPKRHRLISFNGRDLTDAKEIASSNYFNDVLLAGDTLYYAPSNYFNEAAAALYASKPDGHARQTILDKEVYSIIRTNYDTLQLSVASSWYTHKLGSTGAQASGAPAVQTSRVYLDNVMSGHSLWVDNRDGKGVLLSFSKSSNEDKTLLSRSGLRQPVYWLNDKYAVFRVSDSRETADYVLNIEGGEARKISDVTDTSGIGDQFYY